MGEQVQVDDDNPAKDNLGEEVQDSVADGLSRHCSIVRALAEAPNDGVSNPAMHQDTMIHTAIEESSISLSLFTQGSIAPSCPACDATRGNPSHERCGPRREGLVRKAPGRLYKLLMAYIQQPLIPGSHTCCQIQCYISFCWQIWQ